MLTSFPCWIEINFCLFPPFRTLTTQRGGKLPRFSKKFLEEITIPAPETGEVWNLITALWETNENLSQLLGKKYQFSDQIKEYNEEQNNPTLSYKTVEEQYVSPAVKRQIWQTLQVIKEIKKVMGKEPERIFVEMARESQESKRTESRKKHLMDL